MYEAIATFRNRLKAGELLIGSAIYMTDPQSSEALADSVDFLWFDQEHNTMSLEALRGHLMVTRNRGKPGIVRISAVGTPFIKPVLDAGADGVVAPQVRTVEEVRQVVDDCRYPPLGRRGFGPMIPSNYGRALDPEFVSSSNANIFVAVMIETVEAVENIDAILAVPGLDSVVLGPGDLSAALGVTRQLDHPKVVGAMEEVIAKAKSAGVFVGSGLGADPDFAYLQAERGAQWLQMGGDCHYLISFMDQITATVRSRLNR